MHTIGLLALALAGWRAPVVAQLGIVTPEEQARAPFIACKAWFGLEGIFYATPDAPNDPKGRSRFTYYAEKFAKEQGREHVNTDCTQFTALAPSFRQTFVPGYSYYDTSWKKQIQTASFPGLPANWSTTPVPGEDDDEKPAKAPEPGDLKTITYFFPKGNVSTPGYESASIELKYRFIACMGEVHAAYSLDPKSLRASAYYQSKNGGVPVGDVAPPEVATIEMVAVAKPNLFSKRLGSIRVQERYGKVSDGLAAPALGYGCFTGQSQKIGLVKDIVPGKHEPAELDAILNDALLLDHQFIGQHSLKRPLRNAALDNARTWSQEAEEKRQAAEKEEAETRRKIVEAEVVRAKAMADKIAAEVKAYEAARAKYDAELAMKRAADEKYARDMASHEAEVARAAAERKEYERVMEAYRRKTGKGGPD